MHRFLIPSLACLLLSSPALLRAQVPHEIKISKNAAFQSQHAQADAPCGNAGTVNFGPIVGSSNDGAPPPIFLCFNDQFEVVHNGDADLSGDPNPATQPGIAYAFYRCAPTVDGPTLQDIATIPGPGDPCVLGGSSTGLFVTQSVPNGGTTLFFNNGTLQTAFNMGQPLSLFFAPITVDDFANNNYESGQVGFPPGPCVAVNTAAAFEVVYLNAITATGLNNNFGNDCLGRFTIRGGYPQYDPSAVYDIKIYLASNPSIKAIIHTAADQLFHQANVIFSVPQAGLYNVEVEDGKGCPLSFQINMNICDPTDNLTLSLPNTVVPPGGQICVPVTTQNFNIVSGSFSINWDPNVLQYTGINNLNPALDPFTATTLNDVNANLGKLGFILVDDQTGGILTVPDNATLFELCFNAVGQLGDCTPLLVTSNPTFIAWEDPVGANMGFSVDTGQVCIAFLPLALNAQVVNPTCLGTGTLQVTPSGGVEPYEVIVRENPQGMPPGPTYFGTVNTSGQFFTVNDVGSSNNTPVTYEICIEDNNGNGATICTTIVVLIPRLGAQINFTQQPLCNGQSSGIISAVVLEGGITIPNPSAPTYSFAWENVANPNITGNSQTFSNIPAGPYQLTVTNNLTGCSEVALGTLGQPAPIGRELLTTVPASCSGICDGTISYEAEGGTPFAGPAYQYQWTYVLNGTTVGSGFDNPITLSNACAGTYNLVLTDANGCTFTDSVAVTNLRTLDILPNSVFGALCFGENSGSISVTLNESVPSGNPYTFFWVPSGGTQVDNGLNSAYNNLAAGTYTVVAVDNLGCQASEEFTIGQPTQLRIDSLGQTNPGCTFVNSGSLSVQAFGGTGQGSYTYSWNVPGSTNQLSGLPPGTYTVQVTDGNGCTATRVFNLPVPTPPQIDELLTQSVGCGSSGSLTVVASSGVVFVWTNINGAVIDSSATISGLQGGSYIYKVFDALGCLTQDTVTLASVDTLTISEQTLVQPSCFGLSDGQIAVGVQGGNPPYVNYSWSPTQQPNGPVIFNLPAGSYALTVTDNIGCTATASFVLDQPPAIVNTFSTSVTGRVSCFGNCDGSAAPVVFYATTPPTPGDFTFLWQDGLTDSLRTNLCAGPNSVIIQDPFNCFIIDTAFIDTPTQITAEQSTTPANCFGASTGAASVIAAGGNGGPYSYLWNTGANTPNISNIPAGPYTVTITDVNGCTNAISSISVSQPDPILLATTPSDPDCFGKNTGTIKVDATGGTPTYTYLWQNAAGENVGNAQVAQMIGAGNYSVTVTDLNGCTSTTTANLQDPPPVVGDYIEPEPLACFGDETILRINTITGGSGGPYTFSIDFGAPLSTDFPVRISGGKHYITYYDGKGCDFTDSTSLFVPEPAKITVQFDPNSVEIELGESILLSPIVSIGGAAIASFSWTNVETLLNPDDFTLTQAYTFTTTTYTLTVIDTAGCSGTGSITVNIDPNRNVYIPNIFSPGNSSGRNDFFNIYTGLGVEMVNFFRVYDRWGDLMYQRERFMPNSFDLAEGWDGRFNGKFVNPGVYVYVAEVRFLDGRVLTYRGDVTVVR